jgi:hypothetical protein
MLKEKELYLPVKEFMANKPNCLDVFVEAGKQGIGSVDVGIRRAHATWIFYR